MSYFPEIRTIQYEGPQSRNPLAFRWYNPSELIEGKSMKDHLRFSIVYWHTMRGTGSDPFGPGTAIRPWDDGSNSVENALRRVEVAFEIFQKLDAPYYAFHDRDVSPEGGSLRETNAIFDRISSSLKEHQDKTGVKLLWGTANMFSHPRFMHGAATTCNADVFAFAAAQVKKCLEVTQMLGGENYVFWGGREGYQCLYNTLAGHTMMHELDYAGMQGALGSIDANTGDLLLGWDTDQFPTDYYLTAQCMLAILKHGGLKTGGVNFDAKVRRESFEPIDLFHAHVGGMDAFARGLRIAADIRREGVIDQFVKSRYRSWDSGIGAEIEAGKQNFDSLEAYMLEKGEANANESGRQEMLENIFNRYI